MDPEGIFGILLASSVFFILMILGPITYLRKKRQNKSNEVMIVRRQSFHFSVQLFKRHILAKAYRICTHPEEFGSYVRLLVPILTIAISFFIVALPFFEFNEEGRYFLWVEQIALASFWNTFLIWLLRLYFPRRVSFQIGLGITLIILIAVIGTFGIYTSVTHYDMKIVAVKLLITEFIVLAVIDPFLIYLEVSLKLVTDRDALHDDDYGERTSLLEDASSLRGFRSPAIRRGDISLSDDVGRYHRSDTTTSDRKRLVNTNEALIKDLDDRWMKDADDLPITKDIPRFVKKIQITHNGTEVFKPDHAAGVHASILDMLSTLANLVDSPELSEKIQENFSPYFEPISEEPGCFDTNVFKNFLSDIVGKDCNSMKILKLCNQIAIGPGYYRLKDTVGRALPYKDARGRGSWRIFIEISDEAIIVRHRKTEEGYDEPFQFTWSLKIECNRELTKIRDADVEVEEITCGDPIPQKRMLEIRGIIQKFYIRRTENSDVSEQDSSDDDHQDV